MQTHCIEKLGNSHNTTTCRDQRLVPPRANILKNIMSTLRKNTGDKTDLIATKPHCTFNYLVPVNMRQLHHIAHLYPEWTMGKTGLARTVWTDQRVIDDQEVIEGADLL